MSREILINGIIKPDKWTGPIIESKNPNEIGVRLNIPFVDQARHIFCATIIPDLEALNLGITWAETFDEKSKSELAKYLCEAYVMLYVNMIFLYVKNGARIEDTFPTLKANMNRQNAWRVISHYYNEISPKGFSGAHINLEWLNYTTAKELAGLTFGLTNSADGVLFKIGANVCNQCFA